jgi:hypothetical protein
VSICNPLLLSNIAGKAKYHFMSSTPEDSKCRVGEGMGASSVGDRLLRLADHLQLTQKDGSGRMQSIHQSYMQHRVPLLSWLHLRQPTCFRWLPARLPNSQVSLSDHESSNKDKNQMMRVRASIRLKISYLNFCSK